MKNFLVIVLISLAFSCNYDNNKNIENDKDTVLSNYDTIRASVIKLNKGWGYEITVNGKKYINQTIIPAIEGNFTFGSPEDAQKTANLVAQKLLQNIFPPSVNVSELDSLEVLVNKIEIIVD
jgi:hypothetical protein